MSIEPFQGPKAQYWAAVRRTVAPRTMSTCPACREAIAAGQHIVYAPADRGAVCLHAVCFDQSTPTTRIHALCQATKK